MSPRVFNDALRIALAEHDFEVCCSDDSDPGNGEPYDAAVFTGPLPGVQARSFVQLSDRAAECGLVLILAPDRVRVEPSADLDRLVDLVIRLP